MNHWIKCFLDRIVFYGNIARRNSHRIAVLAILLLYLISVVRMGHSLYSNRDYRVFDEMSKKDKYSGYDVYEATYLNMPSDHFGLVNACFVKYDVVSQMMHLKTIKTNQSILIQAPKDLDFANLIERGDNISLVVYHHPDVPVYNLPTYEIGNESFTVVRLTWISGNMVVDQYNISVQLKDPGLYFWISVGFCVLIAFVIGYFDGRNRDVSKLVLEFGVVYWTVFILYMFKTPMWWNYVPYLQQRGPYQTQAAYVIFVLLSSWTMMVTSEIGMKTWYSIKPGEKQSLLALATSVTLISIIITFVGGILSPTIDRVPQLLVPVRMAMFFFGAILGLNSFLLGILGKDARSIGRVDSQNHGDCHGCALFSRRTRLHCKLSIFHALWCRGNNYEWMRSVRYLR